ncbi:plasmid partitioning/stability family protein [Escherichia coli]
MKINPDAAHLNFSRMNGQGDKIADELIANEKLKERGRFMRAMLVTGAAFAAIDKRLPLLISELLTEKYDSG